jgi:hypothetical protein
MSGCPRLVVKLKKGGAMGSVAAAPRSESQLFVERNSGMGKILIIEPEDDIRSNEVSGHVLVETLGAPKRKSRPFSLSGTPGGV